MKLAITIAATVLWMVTTAAGLASFAMIRQAQIDDAVDHVGASIGAGVGGLIGLAALAIGVVAIYLTWQASKGTA